MEKFELYSKDFEVEILEGQSIIVEGATMLQQDGLDRISSIYKDLNIDTTEIDEIKLELEPTLEAYEFLRENLKALSFKGGEVTVTTNPVFYDVIWERGADEEKYLAYYENVKKMKFKDKDVKFDFIDGIYDNAWGKNEYFFNMLVVIAYRIQ